MKDMQTKIVMIGILLSTDIMLRAQDNGGCEDCPAFNAGGKVEVRGVKERIIGDLSQPVAVRVRTLIQQMTLAEKVAQLVSEVIAFRGWIFLLIIIGMNVFTEWLVPVK